jgi:hypothetical protein
MAQQRAASPESFGFGADAEVDETIHYSQPKTPADEILIEEPPTPVSPGSGDDGVNVWPNFDVDFESALHDSDACLPTPAKKSKMEEAVEPTPEKCASSDICTLGICLCKWALKPEEQSEVADKVD